MSFRVGQEVVCVDDSPHPEGFGSSALKRGNTYTVTYTYTNSDGPGVHVAEAKHHPHFAGYRATRFRPIVKTDISIFQSMLISPPVKELVG